MSSAQTWKHPQLGRFEFDGMCWNTKISLPSFKGKQELSFDADDEDDIPSAAAIAVATKVLDSQAELANTVIQAMWDDFNGTGPDSGMWWHGDLNQVANALGRDYPPERPEALRKLMRLSSIHVHKWVHGYKKPVVELCFQAAFEEEHGVGVLTDGQKVLGTGYMSDVLPFKLPRKKKPKR